jgi:hypothetical protein
MMNSIIEFKDACAAGRLNLSTGEKIYSRFRELLGEVFHADWDNAHQGKANSVAGFHKTLNEFISYHFSNTDLIDQKNMLAKAKKPFKYTVEAARVCRYVQQGAVPAAVQGAIAPSIQAYTTGRCVLPIHMGQVSVQACRGSSQGRTMWKPRGRPGTTVLQSRCPFHGESYRGGQRTWIQRRTHVAK